ncbi:MAG: hypothetical protein JST22_12295 [Bacteroidetes bacterium]|nr:hypothetical protein [Bacteroidota bacterium]
MTVELHKLARCGFYLRGVGTPSFGTIVDWWQDFADWANGRVVRTTGTYVDEESVPRRVLCAGATPYAPEGFGVVLWNEMPGTARGIGYISGTALVQKARAAERSLGNDDIPGWATHLWFLPEQNVLVVLIPKIPRGTRGNGLPQARLYFREYLRRQSRYADVEMLERHDDVASYEVTGWRARPGAALRRDVAPQFDTRPLYRHGILDDLPKRYQDIRKIVTSRELEMDSRVHRDLLEFVLSGIGLGHFDRYEHIAPRQHFRLEVPWQPGSPEEVSELVSAWKRAPSSRTGILFHGEPNVHWLDRARSREDVRLPAGITEQPSYTITDLAEVWAAVEPSVYRMLGPGS